MTLRRVTPLRLALLVGLLLAALRLIGFAPFDLLDLRALDYRLLLRGPQPVVPDVVIVAVDDASLGELGRWPWSRPTVGRLIERIAASGAAVIGVDIVQAEASAPADDRQLADAVQATQRTVLGYFFDFSGTVDSPYGGESVYPIVQRAPGGAGEARLRAARTVMQNLPPLVAAARGLGYFNFVPDRDGIYRRALLAIRFADRVALPLSLAMLQQYWPDRPPAIRFDAAGVASVRIGAQALPVEEDGQLLLDYRGRGRSVPHFAAADVLAGRIPPDALRGKLVLLGVTAVGAAGGDVRATPFDPVYPGVEIHATVLDNILRNDFLARPRWAGSARLGLADAALALLLALALGLALQRLRGFAGAAVAAGLLVAALAGSQALFVHGGLVLSAVYPTLAVALAYMTVALHHYVVVDREKRHTRRMLDLYLSPSLSHYVSQHPDKLKLGGEKCDRTVLFSDVRDFTPIAERLAPEQLVELLNLYLGEMTDIVFAHDGMLDKYVGDGVMAVWGAPIPQPDHAVRACRAALAMVDRLVHINAGCSARGWPTLNIRIGLNSGPMVFGNMGSAGHLSLTVMGDNVNLGARLEGINKLYGTTIIASENTLAAAQDVLTVRELDVVRVKGKAQKVRIYEVLGPAEKAAAWQPLIDQFNAGLAAYRARDWPAAVAAFEAAKRIRPNDGPSDLYLRRCREHQATPVADGWEAVTTFGEH